MLGVTTQTLRNWDAQGSLKTVRTKGNQRRVLLSEIERIQGHQGRTVILAYCRCSTAKQKENLERQVGRVLEYAAATGLTPELYKDIGSGLNENRKQFRKLLGRLSDNDVNTVVVEYKDRLSRYGFGTFEAYCNSLGIEVVVMEDRESKEFEQEFSEDIIALIASFSARLYGRRGGRARKEKRAQKSQNSVGAKQ